jgi:hypothetical protein
VIRTKPGADQGTRKEEDVYEGEEMRNAREKVVEVKSSPKHMG